MGRKQLGKIKISAQVEPETAIALQEIAAALGYTYNNKGSQGLLLDAIARHKALITQLLKELEKSP